MSSRRTNHVTELFREVWQVETTELCKIHSYRKNSKPHPNILIQRAYLNGIVHQFNVSQNHTKLTPFSWAKKGEAATTTPTDEEILDSDYYVFGYRFGAENPSYKVAIICHLDTVPAQDSEEWSPFEPTVENRAYPSGLVSPQPFLVGRGTIDDKGPAISALIVARAIARKFDGNPLLQDTQIEISFDPSEETDMSTPHYMEDSNTVVPNFGVVYDAAWNTRAEKGIERPKFSAKAPASAPPEDQIYLHAITTAPNNSINTVPDWAELEIRGDSAALERFSCEAAKLYREFDFGDPDYRRAKIKVASSAEGNVIIHGVVSGAQHGSAPEENRKGGANPLVSLSNFAAGLVKQGKLARWGAPASMCEFIASTWDTRVFGEAHESLYKYDPVFIKDNGTTYAVTKTNMLGAPSDPALGIELFVDIRYAIPHHDVEWDPSCRKEGFLDGDESKFGTIFSEIIEKFSSWHSTTDLPNIQVETESKAPPDIRWPDSNVNFQRIERAYREIVGVDPPRYAIGGGTDAKGYTFLLAVGALFSTSMGPPVNYHGISEGAPITDMEISTNVLYRVMELEISGRRESYELTAMVADKRKECFKRIKHLRKRGFTHGCECLC